MTILLVNFLKEMIDTLRFSNYTCILRGDSKYCRNFQDIKNYNESTGRYPYIQIQSITTGMCNEPP